MPAIDAHDLARDCDRVLERVAAGESFDIVRDGRTVARLAPSTGRRQFVPVDEFKRLFGDVPPIDYAAFRRDVDQGIDFDLHDPYERRP